MRLLGIILWAVFTVINTGFSQSKFQFTDSSSLRIAPSLLREESFFKIQILVTDSAAFINEINRLYPYLKSKRLNENVFEISNLKKNSIQELMKSTNVKFIDRLDRSAKVETLLGEFDFSLNAVRSVQTLYPSLAGDGFTVSIKEKPFDSTDLDLKGRTVQNSQFDEQPTAHATFMATISAGGGNTTPSARGVAWAAGITTSDFDRLLPDDGNSLELEGVSVQNHSYGVGLENYYGIESNAYDQAALSFPKVLHVFSSGNEGEKSSTEGMYAGISGFSTLTGQFKVSKNTISVGSSDRFGKVVPQSSRGPAHDGRVKPELTAFGDAGSSEAAAVVSGISLLLQESYKNQYGELPDIALVKAALINSTEDIGRPEVDFDSGFGSVNALNAIRLIESGNFFSGSVAQGDFFNYSIPVTSGTDLLKVTLVWNDPPANPFSAKALINDLDLTVFHQISSVEWNPWVLNSAPSISSLQENAQRGIDRINNIEQVTIPKPEAGTYEIKIQGYDVSQGPQSFFVVYETRAGFEWVYPLGGDALASDIGTFIRWQWYGGTMSGTLEYRSTSANDWRAIDPDVDLDQLYYEWSPPDTAALIQLRITTGGQQFDSEVFPISKPDRLQVGFNCESEIMFLWNSIPGVEEYTLYSMGEKYLEPLLTTVDTFAIVQKSLLSNNFFSVGPVIGTQDGLRELTIDYELQGTGCYFISFNPRKYLVEEVAEFDVRLGTFYKLQSATLERLTMENFLAIQKIDSFTDNELVFIDNSPTPGTQKYRIKLITDEQQLIYSNEEEIFYVPEDNIFIYPNPVSPGQEVSIVVSDEEIIGIQLYNMHGGLVRSVEDLGTSKTIETADLPTGTYLIRVAKQNGKTWVRKLMIVQ